MADQRMLDVDELRRNPDDGAYHCPRCDAPFTRRSNLRRHYAIHIRNKNFKCHACRKIFGSTEELQYHTVQCPRSVWNASDSNTSTLEHTMPDNVNTEPGSFLDNPASPDFFFIGSPSPPLPTPQHENLDDFFSSLTTASMPPTPPSLSPSLSPFPSLESASSSGLGTPDWPLAKLPSSKLMQVDTIEAIQNLRTRYRSNTPHQNIGPGRRLKSKEKPIYTRRQVEDMLDVMSKTFVERMEDIIRRNSYSDGDFWAHATTTEANIAPGAPPPTQSYTL